VKFVQQVQDHPEHFGEPVKLAVKRHLKDVTRKDIYYDAARADLAMKVIGMLRHTKGEYSNRLFQITPFQEFIIRSIFGWFVKKTGRRRYRKAYIEIARKNGKTELAAAIAILTAYFDNEEGAEVYFAATKRDQAKIGFEAVGDMIKRLQKDSPAVKSSIKIFRNAINKVKGVPAKIEPLSADYDTLDGTSPSCAIIDEYHAHPNDKLLKVIETGMGARINPLLFIITTAGFNKESACYRMRGVCISVLRGQKKDDALFSLIFSLDEKDDWNDQKLWIKANPNLGLTPYLDYMQTMHKSAVNEGHSAEIQFRTKNLNQWTNVRETWVKDADWQKCKGEVNPEALKGRKCFAALDLATTLDICSLCLVFPPESEGEKTAYLWCNWCPEDTAADRSKSDAIDYLQYARDGYLTLTPGNVTDYEYIKHKIRELAQIYDIHTIAYDRWNSSQLVIDLTEDGLKLEPFGQGFSSMSAPTKEFERMILRREIAHGGNPLARWFLSNVQIKSDPAGNVKPDKASSREKIDGIVAAIMATGHMMQNKHAGNAFNKSSDIFLI
jgi:phage terminase large subunit-like protein